MSDPAVSLTQTNSVQAIPAGFRHSHHPGLAHRGPRPRHPLDDPLLEAETADDDAATERTSLLRAYLRDVGSHQVLTRAQEVALAKAIRRHTDALHQNLRAIPFTGRFIVDRWNQLRRAKRATAALAARSTTHRTPEAGARIDRTLSRVEALLDRRARLSERRAQRFRARARIDTEIQRILRKADLSPTIFDEVLKALRGHHAALSRTGQSSLGQQERAGLVREIGLSLPVFSRRMSRIEAHAHTLLELRNRFVEHNLKLVVKIAKEFSGMGLPLIDLVQEGNLILLHAVQKFDHRRGVKFSTYGSWWIRQACIRAIQNQARTVRLPSNVHDRMLRLERLDAKLSSHLNRAPEANELSEALGVSEHQVETLRLVRQKPVSLETQIPGLHGRTVQDAVADPAHLSPLDAIDRTRIARELDELFPHLPSREQRVLRCRFGLGGERPRTLAEIGRLLNLSRERVRQIETAAIAHLRQGLEDRQLIDPIDCEPELSPG